jgi:hypothetical protein
MKKAARDFREFDVCPVVCGPVVALVAPRGNAFVSEEWRCLVFTFSASPG